MSLSGCADVSDPYGTVVTVWPIYLHSLPPTHTHTHTYVDKIQNSKTYVVLIK